MASSQPADLAAQEAKKKEKEQRKAEESKAKAAKLEAKKAKMQQQSTPNGVVKEKKAAPATAAKDYKDTTPYGQKKILVSLWDEALKAYEPKIIEAAWYSWWEETGLLKPRFDKDGKPLARGAYTICIPPPNVTGKLHVGHALATTLEDVLVRFYRMKQYTTLYVPGCDHAGIATQAVVEKRLAKNPVNGRSRRHDFSRPEFIELCQQWKEDTHRDINRTLRRMGASVDWSREAFTMNPQLSKAVRQTFCQLHDEGLIYRANRLVHWSSRLGTALSNLEVDQKELDGITKLDVPGYDKKIEFGALTYFKYPIDGSDEFLEVATTRPETMLGDTGIAVHPDDPRYRHLVGKHARHPIIEGRKLLIVADEYVERDFGTGAVKLTPAHDQNDFNLGKKHDLPFVNILNDDGTLNENAGSYAGEKRFNARYGITAELEKLGLYTKKEPNKMTVPICSRSGDIIEPRLKPQWWMKMESMTKPAIEVVKSGELTIRPEMQKKNYLIWMNDMRDWCLSRQLWWGHQIPAYFVQIEGESGDEADGSLWITGTSEEEAQEKAARKFAGKKFTLRRDEDVLDTWFSSALWPFSTLGWPDKSVDFENFFPTSTMETGWDILTFWVSKMVIMSLKLTGKVPFKDIFCHGLIRDSDGRKMSKSLGNVIDPTDIFNGIPLSDLHAKLHEGNLAASEIKQAEKYQKKNFPQGIPEIGADALRFSMTNYVQPAGGDINFSVATMQSYRRFCNKIYQAAKYVLGKLGEDFKPQPSATPSGKESLPEKWILTKMNTCARQMNKAFEQRAFAQSTQTIYAYLYDHLFDVYIENSKTIIQNGAPEEARSALETLYTTLETGLRLLSPIMPFLTEELWQRLPRRPDDSTQSITIASYPESDPAFDFPEAEEAYELVLGCSKGIRSLLAEYMVKDKGVAYIVPLDQKAYDTASAQVAAIRALCGKIPTDVQILQVGATVPPSCAVYPVSATSNVYLDIRDRIQDPNKEVAKTRGKLEEARKESRENGDQIAQLSTVRDQDVDEAVRSAEIRRRDADAAVLAYERTLEMFEGLKV